MSCRVVKKCLEEALFLCNMSRIRSEILKN